MINHRTFCENGDFIKANDFEQIWIARNVKHDYTATEILNDDEYLDYNLWEDINSEMLYKKHLPKSVVIRGKNPNIIFHGGCLGCLSQRLNGFERCKGCMYFRGNWRKPDLHIKGEEAAEISADEFRRVILNHRENR